MLVSVLASLQLVIGVQVVGRGGRRCARDSRLGGWRRRGLWLRNALRWRWQLDLRNVLFRKSYVFVSFRISKPKDVSEGNE